MASKVRVYAKSQKWAALGIIDAYIKMYPHATVDDLNKAFPLSVLQETKTDEPLLVTVAEKEKLVKASKTTFDDEYFEEWKRTHFYVTLPDGTDLMFTVAMWPKEMFEKMMAQAKLYDIEFAKYEAAEKGIGKRGEYTLEYLNGYVPPKPEEKKSKNWLWILLAILLIIIIIILLLMRGCQKPAEPQIVEVEKVVVVHDTLYIQQIEEIEKNFNAAEFVQGKADLSESAKFVLHDLAKVLDKNPELRLRLEGHTSAEGDAAFNQKLSEARAQAAVDFLIEHEGIDASRLEAVGKGSSELKNTADPMASENRRTEFIVLE